MSEPACINISLSADETALVFSLINQAEMGKSILQSTYGKISSSAVEEKLTTASHSLLARGFASITQKGTVSLQNNIESAFYPLVKFYNILQVTINSNQEDGPEIINIYLGRQKNFTALRTRMGVVYEFTYGNLDHLAQLVNDWLGLPQNNDQYEELSKSDLKISMLVFAKLDSMSSLQSAEKLQKIGFSKRLADALLKDVQSPHKRGSVMLTEMTSENYQTKNIDEGGAGFLYLAGKVSCWLLTFTEANDNTVLRVIPGGNGNVVQQISLLVAK